MKQLTMLVLAGVFAAVPGAQLATADDQQPIHCSTICKNAKAYACCFAVCVCHTDPDPDVRRDYCADVPYVCTEPRS